MMKVPFKKLFDIWIAFSFCLYVVPIFFVSKNMLPLLASLAVLAFGTVALLAVFSLFMRRIVQFDDFGSNNEKEVAVPVPAIILFIISVTIAILGSDIFQKFNLWSVSHLFSGSLYVIKELSIAVLFIVSCFSLGNFIFSLLKKEVSFSKSLTFSLAIGMIFFSLLFFLFGVVGLFYPSIAWIAVSLPIIIFRKRVLYVVEFLWKKKFNIRFNSRNIFSFNGLAYLMIAIFFFMFFISSFGSVISGGMDTFHQYLTFPSEYAKNHRIVEFYYHPHFGFPQFGEMLYTAGILLGDAGTPFVFAFFIICLSIVSFISIVSRFGRRYHPWVVLIFITIPFISGFSMGYLKVEPLLIFYVLASFMSLDIFFKDTADDIFLVLFFIFSSITLDIKYTGVFILSSAFIALLFLKKKACFNLKKALLFMAIATVFFSPWIAKDIFYYKSPLYPIISGNDKVHEETGLFCQGDFVKNSKEDMFANYKDQKLFNGNYILSNAFLFARETFIGWSPNLVDIGPWLAVLFPLGVVFIFRIKDKFVMFLYVFSFVYFVFWLIFMAGQTWYLLPSFIGFLIIFSYVAENNAHIRNNTILKIAIILWVFWDAQIFLLFGYFPEKIGFIRNEISFEDALVSINKKNSNDSRISSFRIQEYLNKDVFNNDKKGLVYGFEDMYDGYFIDNSHERFIPDLFGYMFSCFYSSGDALGKFKSLGVKYFIVDSKYNKLCKSVDNQNKFAICRAEKNFERFLDEHGHVMRKDGTITLLYID